MTIDLALAFGAAYGIGSVPFGLILVKLLRGTDIRRSGSGNIGATNALRTAGKTIGLFTLLLDAGKGVLGSLAAAWIVRSSEATPGPAAGALIFAAPVIGHCFPLWLGFRGGKGVSTVLGVLGVADYRLVLVTVAVLLTLFVPTGWVALGSIGGAVAAAVAAPLINGSGATVWGTVICSAIIVWRHRENIARMWRGEEPRLFRGRRGATEDPR